MRSWVGSVLVTVVCASYPVATHGQAVCHDQWSAWAPDGVTIVFTSTATGDHEIYTRSLETGALRRLTATPGRDAHPSFSPDGTTVAFQSPRNGGDTHLFLMNPDGSEVRQVTNLTGFAGMPVWSPHGDRLAFQHRSNEQGAKWTLYVVSLSDGDVTPLTEGAADDQVVNWGPDGNRLLFHSDRTGVNQVFLWDDGTVQQLTRGPFEHRNATWSPDGSRIALRSTRGGEHGIYLMTLDRLEMRRVGDVSIEHGVPFFSPEGTRLLLTPSDPNGTRMWVFDIQTGESRRVPGACGAG